MTTKKTTTILLPDDLREAIWEITKRERISMAQVIIRALREYLNDSR